MTKRIEVDSWLQDSEPFEIIVEKRRFRVRPLTFNQALVTASLTSSMSSEYMRALAESAGEQDIVTDRETNLLVGAILSKVEFAGMRPDWLQRRRLARLIRRRPITVRLLLIKEISDHFTDYLRTSIAPFGLSVPEVKNRPTSS